MKISPQIADWNENGQIASVCIVRVQKVLGQKSAHFHSRIEPRPVHRKFGLFYQSQHENVQILVKHFFILPN